MARTEMRTFAERGASQEPKDDAEEASNIQLVQSVATPVDEVRRAVPRDAFPRRATGAMPIPFRRRGPGAGNGNLELRSALKASWARYTPAEREARIGVMRLTPHTSTTIRVVVAGI